MKSSRRWTTTSAAAARTCASSTPSRKPPSEAPNEIGPIEYTPHFRSQPPRVPVLGGRGPVRVLPHRAAGGAGAGAAADPHGGSLRLQRVSEDRRRRTGVGLRRQGGIGRAPWREREE